MVTGGTGTVLASFGRGVLLGTPEGLVRCGLRSRRLRVVCGDRVIWSYPPSADGPSVDGIEPRRNLIERIDARGRPEPVAANIDRLAIVVAAEPKPDWFLVDRYWAGAELKDLEAMLILNKSDLDTGTLEPELEEYRHLRLPCVAVSCETGSGFAGLSRLLEGAVTLLVGQSGVGKSSLVNRLAPEAQAGTAELTRDAEGRHTTTTARWYPLDGASAIVDAPGVRDFAPPASLARAAERGFVEIRERSAQCRFKDCRHMEEPGCAVRTAVTQQKIAPRRYESYRRLFRLYEKLAG
jgi:ribosome biogenesis GTPase